MSGETEESSAPTADNDQQQQQQQQQQQLEILIECCSAWNLKERIDAYISVTFAGQTVHETKSIWKSRNPIWTIKQNNVFILKTTEEELRSAGGLVFTIKDYNFARRNKSVAGIFASGKDVMNAIASTPSKRYEYDVLLFEEGDDELASLDDEVLRRRMMSRASYYFKGGSKIYDSGLALRFRLATEEDKIFMKNHDPEKGSKEKAESGLDKLMNTAKVNKYSMFTKMKKYNKATGETLYRVQPEPDPLDVEGTKWMSSQQLKERALEPSRNWIDAGSGNHRIFLEIIGCDGLPDMDTVSLSKRDQTDSFVSIVYEDTAVVTDVINDTLSPRWMPWHQRAFVLRVLDPKSVVFVGVFDRDEITSDDFIGHIALRPAKFIANTEYLLHYNLYDSSTTDDPTTPVDDRKVHGKLILRLRYERGSGVGALWSTITPHKTTYVNTCASKNLELMKKTCMGKDVPPDRYDTSTFVGYITEITGDSKIVLNYCGVALLNIFLWRGSVVVPIPQFKRTTDQETKYVELWAPINSIIAFAWGCVLVEHSLMLPAFLVFCVPWLLLGRLKEESKHPSPWHKPRSVVDLFKSLFNVKLHVTIAPHEFEEEELAYQKILSDKELQVKRLDEEAMKCAEEERLRKEEETKLIGDNPVDIETKYRSFTLNPLNGLLYPIQELLFNICKGMRFTRNFLKWEIPGSALTISIVCLVISIILAAAAPWLAWFVCWTLRLMVWIFLGPLMAIADKCYFSKKIDAIESHDHSTEKSSVDLTITDQLEKQMEYARTDREDAIKLKAMRCYRFGRYVNMTPTFGVSRYPDIPLLESSAMPFEPKAVDGVNVIRQKGSLLTGTMIHGREEEHPPAEHVYGVLPASSEDVVDETTEPNERSSLLPR